MITFLSLGCAIGSVAKSPRAANVISMILFMPMLFLSDMFMPIAVLPAGLQPVCRALPLTPLNVMLRDVIYGAPLDEWWQPVILAGWLIVGIIVILKFFKWE